MIIFFKAPVIKWKLRHPFSPSTNRVCYNNLKETTILKIYIDDLWIGWCFSKYFKLLLDEKFKKTLTNDWVIWVRIWEFRDKFLVNEDKLFHEWLELVRARHTYILSGCCRYFLFGWLWVELSRDYFRWVVKVYFV